MVASILAPCLLLLTTTEVSAIAYKYAPTPFGEVLAHCMHEVPNGAHSEVLADGSFSVTALDGTRSLIPPCDTDGGKWPVFRTSDRGAKQQQQQQQQQPNPLPADYDGWLQYTVLNTSSLGLSGGFDAFTSVMSVPDVPKEKAHMLYFFPGLQNRDWIPKVDPFPTLSNPFDIIQPVLQYPGEGLFHGSQWALKSWYVTIHAGALYSKAITGVQPGDAILCNMTRTGPQSWRVSGALQSSPSQITVQEAMAPRLELQPWAYSAVAECYGCDGCDTYPMKPIKFTENRLYQAGQEVPVPEGGWRLNVKPAEKLMCNEATTVASNGDATIAFQ